jgi:N utilization substance protein A
VPGRQRGRGQRGAQVTVSRTHPDLVRGLFALEVPEIADGSVEIAALAREAGHRTRSPCGRPCRA